MQKKQRRVWMQEKRFMKKMMIMKNAIKKLK